MRKNKIHRLSFLQRKIRWVRSKDMKKVLIIGMGKFGRLLAQNMIKLGNEVVVIDKDKDAMEKLVLPAKGCRIGDCTNAEVLKKLGIDSFDIVFVCMSEDFQSSLEITSLVKDLGARYVISRADRDTQAKFLLKNGADEVVYPEREAADKLASRCSVDNVFDYIELTEGYAIYEIPVKKEWVGKSIIETNFRRKYNINILGMKRDERLYLMPGADYVFSPEEHLIVLGHKDDIKNIL